MPDKKPEIIVRWRRPKCGVEWETAGTLTFTSWRAAWAYIDGEDDAHPRTGERLGTYSSKTSLRNWTRKINVAEFATGEKGDLWFLDIWGTVELAERKAAQKTRNMELRAMRKKLAASNARLQKLLTKYSS